MMFAMMFQPYEQMTAAQMNSHLQVLQNGAHVALLCDDEVDLMRSCIRLDGRKLENLYFDLERGEHNLSYELIGRNGMVLESDERRLSEATQDDKSGSDGMDDLMSSPESSELFDDDSVELKALYPFDREGLVALNSRKLVMQFEEDASGAILEITGAQKTQRIEIAGDRLEVWLEPGISEISLYADAKSETVCSMWIVEAAGDEEDISGLPDALQPDESIKPDAPSVSDDDREDTDQSDQEDSGTRGNDEEQDPADSNAPEDTSGSHENDDTVCDEDSGDDENARNEDEYYTDAHQPPYALDIEEIVWAYGESEEDSLQQDTEDSTLPDSSPAVSDSSGSGYADEQARGNADSSENQSSVMTAGNASDRFGSYAGSLSSDSPARFEREQMAGLSDRTALSSRDKATAFVSNQNGGMHSLSPYGSQEDRDFFPAKQGLSGLPGSSSALKDKSGPVAKLSSLDRQYVSGSRIYTQDPAALELQVEGGSVSMYEVRSLESKKTYPDLKAALEAEAGALLEVRAQILGENASLKPSAWTIVPIGAPLAEKISIPGKDVDRYFSLDQNGSLVMHQNARTSRAMLCRGFEQIEPVNLVPREELRLYIDDPARDYTLEIDGKQRDAIVSEDEIGQPYIKVRAAAGAHTLKLMQAGQVVYESCMAARSLWPMALVPIVLGAAAGVICDVRRRRMR